MSIPEVITPVTQGTPNNNPPWDRDSGSFIAARVSIYALNIIAKIIATVTLLPASAGLGFLVCGGPTLFATGNMVISVLAGSVGLGFGVWLVGGRVIPETYNIIDTCTFSLMEKLSGVDFK